ncbi:MAG: hypothetical protein J6K20_05620 [Thermoguttaceae bacterium]|nr:hypothetical protein [Thermoguttaceae bacterium]
MNENETKDCREVPENESAEDLRRETIESQFEAATLPNGLETYVLKGTRVVSQVEEIARLNERIAKEREENDGLKQVLTRRLNRVQELEKELGESRERIAELEERVEKLKEASEIVVKDCETRVARLQKLFESTSADARKIAEELAETRSQVFRWRLIALSGFAGAVIGSVINCILQG